MAQVQCLLRCLPQLRCLPKLRCLLQLRFLLQVRCLLQLPLQCRPQLHSQVRYPLRLAVRNASAAAANGLAWLLSLCTPEEPQPWQPYSSPWHQGCVAMLWSQSAKLDHRRRSGSGIPCFSFDGIQLIPFQALRKGIADGNCMRMTWVLACSVHSRPPKRRQHHSTVRLQHRYCYVWSSFHSRGSKVHYRVLIPSQLFFREPVHCGQGRSSHLRMG